MISRLLAIFMALGLIVFAIGCDDDEDGCANCPHAGDQELNFQTAWPSADGNSWDYDLAHRAFEGDPADLVDPEDPDPQLPDLETLYARLTEPVTTPALGQSEGLYRLQFAEEVTMPSGGTARRLIEQLESSALDGAAKGIGDELTAPQLLGRYAIAATDTGLFGYGEASTEYTWVYLAGELEIGHQFSLQLAHGVPAEVWLYGTVRSRADLTLGDHTYADCLECFYVLDLGVGRITDEFGEVHAKARIYTIGSVFYAPGLGPVHCHERHYALYATAYEPTGVPVVFEWEASLASAEVAP